MADRRAHSRRRRYRCTPDRRLSAAPAEQLYRLPYLPRWTHDCAAMGLCRRCDRDQCRDDTPDALVRIVRRSVEHTSELQSLMRISDAVFCLNKKNKTAT